MNILKNVTLIFILIIVSSACGTKWFIIGNKEEKIDRTVTIQGCGNIIPGDTITLINAKGEYFGFLLHDKANLGRVSYPMNYAALKPGKLKRKNLKLTTEHPSYISDTIEIKRSLRFGPLIGDLALTGLSSGLLAPVIGLDFYNNNIWKIKKRNSVVNAILTPKYEYFAQKVDTLAAHFMHQTATNDKKDKILNDLLLMHEICTQETFSVKLSATINQLSQAYAQSLVEERNIDKLKFWIREATNGFENVFMTAEKECLIQIQTEFNRSQDDLLNTMKFVKKDKWETIAQLNEIDQLLNLKKIITGLSWSENFIQRKNDIIIHYIDGAFIRVESYRDSTRDNYKNASYSEISNIRKLVQELNGNFKNYESLTINLQSKLDSLNKELLGFKAFCLYSSNLSGYKYSEPVCDKLIYDCWYKKWVKEKYASDPTNYKKKIKFEEKESVLTFTFPKHIFKNDQIICVVKNDFPDETRSTLHTPDKYSKDVIKEYYKHVYYKYYEVTYSQNNSYNKNMAIAEENGRQVQRNLQQYGNTTIEANVRSSEGLKTTGSLHKNAMTFRSIKGPNGGVSSDMSSDDQDRYWHRQVGVGNYYTGDKYISHYENILNALKSDYSGSYFDYGEGFKFRGEYLENLFINHSCDPDSGGIYD